MRNPVLLRYDEGHEQPWWLSRGGETFFPDEFVPNWKHLRWKTREDAIAWAQENLGETPLLPLRQASLLD